MISLVQALSLVFLDKQISPALNHMPKDEPCSGRTMKHCQAVAAMSFAVYGSPGPIFVFVVNFYAHDSLAVVVANSSMLPFSLVPVFRNVCIFEQLPSRLYLIVLYLQGWLKFRKSAV